MKKIGLLLFIILAFPIFASGQETGSDGDVLIQLQKSMEDYRIPGIPVFYVKKLGSHLIGIGFLLNSPDSFEEDSPLRYLLEEFPLFQAAILLQGKNYSSSIIFSYDKNKIWGLSAKFSF